MGWRLQVNWQALWKPRWQRTLREALVLPLIILVMLVPLGLFTGWDTALQHAYLHATLVWRVAIAAGGAGDACSPYCCPEFSSSLESWEQARLYIDTSGELSPLSTTPAELAVLTRHGPVPLLLQEILDITSFWGEFVFPAHSCLCGESASSMYLS